MKPDVAAVAIGNLFQLILAGVPFVDVINTMMDPSIPLTINEYEEWGNPNEKEYFDYILSYSPYENIQSDKEYPHILIKAGLNDPRVQYWEPMKWISKLRANNAHRDGKKVSN
jgi:oligopeptidase B